MSEIKPCPFCGSHAKFKSSIVSGSDEKNHLGNIHCDNCYARTGSNLQIFNEAVKNWNTRHPQLGRAEVDEEKIEGVILDAQVQFIHPCGLMHDQRKYIAHAIKKAIEEGRV